MLIYKVKQLIISIFNSLKVEMNMILLPGLEVKERDHEMIWNKIQLRWYISCIFLYNIDIFLGFPDFLASLQYVNSYAIVLSISLSQVVDAMCITNTKAIRRRISNIVDELFYCRVTSPLP